MKEQKYTEDDLLMLSGIQHFRFCKRQWALIHIERQWEDNLHTQEGHFVHEKVDDPFFNESRGDVIISRAVPVVSYCLGLNGIIDVIEYSRTEQGISLPGRTGLWSLKPVEYKRGKPKIDERDEVQLCAQVMCLEEMFSVRINKADFYYNEIRRRLHLTISDELRDLVASLADEMHQIFNKGITPAAEPGKHCSQCSLVDLCVPKLTKKKVSVDGYIRRHILTGMQNDC